MNVLDVIKEWNSLTLHEKIDFYNNYSIAPSPINVWGEREYFLNWGSTFKIRMDGTIEGDAEEAGYAITNIYEHLHSIR